MLTYLDMYVKCRMIDKSIIFGIMEKQTGKEGRPEREWLDNTQE